MKLGNKINKLLILFFFFTLNIVYAENKITSTPLINLDQIKPSFEETDQIKENLKSKQIKEKKNKPLMSKSPHAILIGLDKITAKSSKLIVNLDEVKKFGPLEIKILKCGKVKINNKIDDVAYMQVKDLTKGRTKRYLYLTGGLFPLILI